MSDPGPPSERRRATREATCFPAYALRPEHAREPVLVADLSPDGALVLVRGAGYAVGEPVSLEMYIDVAGGKVRSATGQVLREEPMPPERASVWTHQVAVRFDAAIALDPEEERMIREQCDALGVRR